MASNICKAKGKHQFNAKPRRGGAPPRSHGGNFFEIGTRGRLVPPSTISSTWRGNLPRRRRAAETQKSGDRMNENEIRVNASLSLCLFAPWRHCVSWVTSPSGGAGRGFSRRWQELVAEGGGSLLKVVDQSVVLLALVGGEAGLHEGHAVLERSVDENAQLASGRDGSLGRPAVQSDPAVEGAERGLRATDAHGGLAQRLAGAVLGRTAPRRDELAARDRGPGSEVEPGGEVFLRGPPRHIGADLGHHDERRGGGETGDLGQVDVAAQPMQGRLDLEPGLVVRGVAVAAWWARFGGPFVAGLELGEQRFNALVALRRQALVQVIGGERPARSSPADARTRAAPRSARPAGRCHATSQSCAAAGSTGSPARRSCDDQARCAGAPR